MDITGVLGYTTVVLNFVVILLLLITIYRLVHKTIISVQFILLITAMVLLLPVMTFESILFIDITSSTLNLTYSEHFMKFLFVLGIVAYFIYNLHLLTIEDLPSLPVTITAIMAGFAMGTVVVSAKLDPTRSAPIYYDPLVGGTLFILTLMGFNLIGGLGFILSIYGKPWRVVEQKVSIIDLIAVVSFFASPAVIFVSRIMRVAFLPVNSIFLLTLTSFTLHLTNYIFWPSSSGYPVHPDLVSLSVIDLEKNVVIAGYTNRKDNGFNKLQGMTMIALDSVVQNMFEVEKREFNSYYSMEYGDTILLKHNNYLLLALFQDGGKKIGRSLLKLFLWKFEALCDRLTDKTFHSMVVRYLGTYFHKKVRVIPEMLYFSKPT